MHIFPNRLYQKTIATCLLFATGLLAAPIAHADELRGDKFVIKMGTINIGGSTETGRSIKLIDTVGQTTPGEFETLGFRLKSGFTYLPSKEPFGFAISRDNIDFGTLLPNTFYRNQVSLTINGAGVSGYHVSLIEDHPISLVTKETFIPDTTCDASQTCSISTAAPWTSMTAYGFGYTMSGDDVDPSQFPDQTYYRPLPNNAASHDPVVVMAQQTRAKIATASATFAVNVSPTQPNGIYENIIQFIALPSY